MPQVTKSKHSAVCYTKSFSCIWLCNPTDCSPPGSSVHGVSPGKNTGVDCYAFLQGIFLTQGSNPGLQHCRQILYHLSHQGSTRILEWVAYTFSRGSSRPRNWTRVFCIAGGFFTSWAIREAHFKTLIMESKLKCGQKKKRNAYQYYWLVKFVICIL